MALAIHRTNLSPELGQLQSLLNGIIYICHIIVIIIKIEIFLFLGHYKLKTLRAYLEYYFSLLSSLPELFFILLSAAFAFGISVKVFIACFVLFLFRHYTLLLLSRAFCGVNVIQIFR